MAPSGPHLLVFMFLYDPLPLGMGWSQGLASDEQNTVVGMGWHFQDWVTERLLPSSLHSLPHSLTLMEASCYAVNCQLEDGEAPWQQFLPTSREELRPLVQNP